MTTQAESLRAALTAARKVASEYGKLRVEAGSPRLDQACSELALAMSRIAAAPPTEGLSHQHLNRDGTRMIESPGAAEICGWCSSDGASRGRRAAAAHEEEG